jgi:hypothetical protein
MNPISETAHDIQAIAARIEADLALLRQVCIEPVSIKLSEKVDIEVRPSTDDDRVLVGRADWGCTVVNYTSEGLILDVYADSDLEPIHTANVYRDELESPYDSELR